MRRFLTGIYLLFYFIMPSVAMAAAVEPSASDLTVTPGEAATATILVRNDADREKNYQVTFAQVQFGATAEDMSFTALSADLAGAISATPSFFSLGAHAERTVDVIVQLPTGASAQSPTVAILVTEKAARGEVGNVLASVASLLFLHVPGGLTRSYVIDSFAAVPATTFRSSIMLSAVFHNDGEETVVLPNEVRVFGPFGREIGRGLLSPEPKHLPPGTTRGVTLSWPATTGFSRLLFGTYTFELWDGDQNRAQTRATMLSPAVFGAVGVIFGLVILGIIIYVRRRT